MRIRVIVLTQFQSQLLPPARIGPRPQVQRPVRAQSKTYRLEPARQVAAPVSRNRQAAEQRV
jgi:hypothetical protein